MKLITNFFLPVLIMSSLLAVRSPGMAYAVEGCKFDQPSDKLCKPIAETNVKDFALKILQYIMGIITIIAVLAIVIAGARMTGSGGNQTAIKEAKDMAWWAAVGFALALLSYSIIAAVRSAIVQ